MGCILMNGVKILTQGSRIAVFGSQAGAPAVSLGLENKKEIYSGPYRVD